MFLFSKDAIIFLEDGFKSKMQAEMLVLVDVLYKPALVFQSNYKLKPQQRTDDKKFIAKYENLKIHFKILK